MTDETSQPESDYVATRPIAPSLLGRDLPQTRTFAFAKTRVSRKTTKPVKAEPPARNALTSYAQILRWSFGSTLLLIAGLVTLIFITRNAGQPPFYPFAVLAGALGAFMSSLIRLYNDQQFPRLLNSQGFIGLKRWDLTIYALVPPTVGVLAASLLFIAFAAAILEGGALFPTFACDLGDGLCGSFQKFIYNFGPKDATDYARTLVWCFVAGFAERLVPDKLKGLAASMDGGGVMAEAK